jgi:predicted CopG family antitoxin
LILSPIRPFTHGLIGEAQAGVEYCEKINALEHPDCFGTLIDVSISSIVDALRKYVSTSFKEKKSASEVIRRIYENRHKTWVDTMKTLLPEVMDKNIPEYHLKDVFPTEDNLPDVSIVTLTKDRRVFMPLAKYCYLLQTYPEDKMEWIIVDDGTDSIEDTLIGIPNVVYVRCDPGMTIGQKRNLGVSKALYDIVMFCDDDDVYPENTVLHRTAMMLKEPAKECGFCTTIPCYDITKYSSFMNVPPMTLPMSQRVSEATLVFTKKFWEERPFDETDNIAEGDAFIRGREQMCRELSPQEVIVSLTHPKNLSSRKIPDFKEPNGCHYGFNEKLFALVSEIGLALNTSGQTESGETCETSSSCETSGGDHQ